ncbi:MAG: AEC family transporter [Orrella sp.]
MLIAVLDAVVPVFGLILLGWFASRRGLLSANASDALNRFVIYFALPALLFVAMARADIDALTDIEFAISYGGGTLLTMLIYIWLSRRDGLTSLTRTINSMSSGYANTGFMGVPLILMVLGPEALPPLVIMVVLTISLQFALTVIAIEWQQASGKSLMPVLGKVGLSLLKNPILVAPILGLLSAATDFAPPSALMGLMDLLADAATPCALLTIGLFLAQSPIRSASPAVPQIVLLKLFVHPLIVGVMALFVFDLSPVWAWAGILAAALPVGTGPFMLASLYREDPAVSARAIFISTLGSVLTLSLIIAWLNLQSIV